jgi:hypothetical protein
MSAHPSPASGNDSIRPREAAVCVGNAGSNTAADHLVAIREALRQLPLHTSGGAVLRRDRLGELIHEYAQVA